MVHLEHPSRITIRGGSTFTGENQPLIVVDGVPMDNQTFTSSAGDNPFNANLSGVSNSNRALDLNPDDIESVSILKGPAAAALMEQGRPTAPLCIRLRKENLKEVRDLV